MKKDTNNLPYIVAVDFDGTLVTNKFPEIGEPNELLIQLIKQLKKQHPEDRKFILWTCRNNSKSDYLDQAVKYLAYKHELVFDAVNTNLKEVQDIFGGDTRKVFANEYWDDKNHPFIKPINWEELTEYALRK